MGNVKIGDVVHGVGFKHERECLILVEKINRIFDGTVVSISGKVVGESGKISSTRDAILRNDMPRDAGIDYSEPNRDLASYGRMPVEKKGGWVVIPDFEIIDQGKALTETIRDLHRNESIDVNKEDHSVNTCRCTASIVGDATGNIYRVSKTETGCTITRVE